MKRLKYLIVSMMIVLISVILLSETQATNGVVEKETHPSAPTFEEDIAPYHYGTCFIVTEKSRTQPPFLLANT
jgi:hypothetical protein